MVEGKTEGRDGSPNGSKGNPHLAQWQLDGEKGWVPKVESSPYLSPEFHTWIFNCLLSTSLPWCLMSIFNLTCPTPPPHTHTALHTYSPNSSHVWKLSCCNFGEQKALSHPPFPPNHIQSRQWIQPIITTKHSLKSALLTISLATACPLFVATILFHLDHTASPTSRLDNCSLFTTMQKNPANP